MVEWNQVDQTVGIFAEYREARPLTRHGRACPGHPRLQLMQVKDVDGRDEHGHNDVERLRPGKLRTRLPHQPHPASCRLTTLASAASRRLVLDRIAQDADPLDLDLTNVAVPHPGWRLAGMANARWRAREQEIAGLERDALGRIDDGFGDRKHHVRGVV